MQGRHRIFTLGSVSARLVCQEMPVKAAIHTSSSERDIHVTLHAVFWDNPIMALPSLS